MSLKESEELTIKLDSLLSKRLESIKEISEKYDKLYMHIKPMLEYDKEMLKLAHAIHMELVALPVLDMTVSMTLLTHTRMLESYLEQARANIKRMAKEVGLPEELFDFQKGRFDDKQG